MLQSRMNDLKMLDSRLNSCENRLVIKSDIKRQLLRATDAIRGGYALL